MRTLLSICVVYACQIVALSSRSWGFKRSPNPPIPTAPRAVVTESLPLQWSWCDVDGVNYCADVWNQHAPVYCGGCWSFASAGTLSDRVTIAYDNAVRINLAVQVINNCVPDGCDGGDPSDAYEYFVKTGLPDMSCMAHDGTGNGTQCQPENVCRNCWFKQSGPYCYGVPQGQYPLYRGSSWGIVAGEAAMQAEIYARGSITCDIVASDAFYDAGMSEVSHSPLYVYTGPNCTGCNATDIDHDVTVVGWGGGPGSTEPWAAPYWLLRNSWGSFWGDRGYMKVERGDMLLLGTNCYYGVVARPRSDAVEHRAGRRGPARPSTSSLRA